MPVEPWGSYPPEVNAGRIIAGDHGLSWLATSLQWKAQAALIAEQIIVLNGVLASFTENWQGDSGPQMVAKFQPYANWLHHMEATALQNGADAGAVAASYGVALSGTVPVPVITANRVATRAAEATAQAAAASAAIPGAAPASLAVAASASATAAQLEAQYAGMWGVNSSTMTSYDAAVTTATTPKVPQPSPEIVVGPVSGRAGTLMDAIQRHGGSDNLVSNVQDQIQQATSQLTGGGGSPMMSPQMMGQAAPFASGVARGAMAPLTTMGLGNYSQRGNLSSGNQLSDSEFRSLLGNMSQGNGGLRSMGSLSSGAGGGGTSFSGGSSGLGSGGLSSSSSSGTLGLLDGNSAADSESVFGGVPPTGAPAAPVSPTGSGMMPPMGAGGGARGGSTSSTKTEKVVDKDTFSNLINTIQTPSSSTVEEAAESVQDTSEHTSQRAQNLLDSVKR